VVAGVAVGMVTVLGRGVGVILDRRHSS
jgi:hypothetical protein